MNPVDLATEPDPWKKAAALAAAIIYDQADQKAEQDQKAKSK